LRQCGAGIRSDTQIWGTASRKRPTSYSLRLEWLTGEKVTSGDLDGKKKKVNINLHFISFNSNEWNKYKSYNCSTSRKKT
jgi:hypothetical protein